VGANPLVSNGSALTVPDLPRRLKALRKRGGALVVVDPVRTTTARRADQHLFIRPGTDALFLLALIHVILDEELVGEDRRADHLRGLADVRAIAADFPPEVVAEATGIPADTTRELARRFAGAGSAVCYGRMGTSTQEFGTLATWAADVLNAITGNLDRPGGAMFATPAVDLAGLASLTGQTGTFDTRRSRVQGLPEFMGEYPVAALIDEMETAGEGRVRGLVTHAGNPALSIPDGRRLGAALQSLEYFVAIDLYVNETTRHAHLILPPTFGLQREVYPLLFLGLAVRNTARYGEAVLARGEGERHDWQILGGLARRLAGRRGLLWRLAGAALGVLQGRLGPRGLLAWMIRMGPHGKGLAPWGRGLTVDALRAEPHGVDLGPLEPRLPRRLATADRTVNLAPAPIRGDLERLKARLGEPVPGETLSLVGRRHPRSFNSWMHNIDKLAGGSRRCTLQLHPDDAAARGITDGDEARIATHTGAVVAPVEVTDRVMPGVVCLPHGWGHGQPGTRLSVANEEPGVNLNDLIAVDQVDALAGTSRLSGIPVSVEPVEPGST